MSRASQQVTKLFEEIDVTPWGPHERQLVDEAVRLATESGDTALEYRARMRLTSSAKHGGDTDTMLASFAWCLAKHDEDPVRFPLDVIDGGADLMWHYKWMAGTLSASPVFTRAQIDDVIADMQRHYDKEGIGPSGVLSARFDEAWMNGRIEDAERLRIELATTPRDEHSHCDACGRSQVSGFLAETGRLAEALVLVEEMIAGDFSCGDEPEYALARAVLPYLRSGRLDDARDAHLRSYRMSRDQPDKLGIVAHHLLFCAVTGNEARGLTLVERHLPWLGHDGLNSAAHFSALVSFAVVLDAVARAGHGGTRVRGVDAPGLDRFFARRQEPWTAEELAAAAWQAAERIGRDFDARNGNDYYAQQILRGHALADEHYDLPLDTDGVIAPSSFAPQEPSTGAEWRQRALDLAGLGEIERALAAAEAGLVDASPSERVDLRSLQIGGLVHLGREDEAEALLVDRLAALRAAGREEQAALEDRRGLALFGRATDADKAALEVELESLRGADVPPSVLADVQLSLASILMRAGEDEVSPDRIRELLVAAERGFDDPETSRGFGSALAFRVHFELGAGDTAAATEAVERVLSSSPSRGARFVALIHRARLHGGADEFLEGGKVADEAMRLASELDVRDAAVTASTLAAALWSDAGRPDEAVSRYRFAIGSAELAEQPTTGLRFSLGRELVRAGRASEAVDVLQSVYEDETATAVSPDSRAETLYWLGDAFAGIEEFGTALRVWEDAAELATEGESPAGAARARLAMGRLYGGFGQHDDAVEELETAAREARKSPDDLRLLTDVLHALGTAQARTGSPEGLATLDEVLSIAEQHGADWLAADVTDSRARALASLGRTDEAIALASRGAERYLAAGDESGAANADLFLGGLLAGAGRDEDAVEALRRSIARATNAPGIRSAAGMQLGDALERLGRPVEANEARAEAERI